MKLLIIALIFTSCKFDKVETVVETVGPSQNGASDSRPRRWSQSTVNSKINFVYSTDFTGDFVGSDYDNDNLNPIEQMLANWNEAFGSTPPFIVPANSTSNKEYSDLEDFYDNEMGIYKSESWYSEITSAALAITQYFGTIRNSGSSNEYLELNHADIILNYKDHTFSTDASSFFDYDFASVVVHEMGHFLGLRHITDLSVASVMHPTLSIFSSKRELEQRDQNDIQTLYEISGIETYTQPLKQFKTKYESGTKIRGIIELRKDGWCHHFENGIKTKSHFIKKFKKLP